MSQPPESSSDPEVGRKGSGELERIIAADLEEEQRCARQTWRNEVFHPGKTSHREILSYALPTWPLPILFQNYCQEMPWGISGSLTHWAAGYRLQLFQGSGVLSVRTSIWLKLWFYSCLLVSLINVFTYEEISSWATFRNVTILERKVICPILILVLRFSTEICRWNTRQLETALEKGLPVAPLQTLLCPMHQVRTYSRRNSEQHKVGWRLGCRLQKITTSSWVSAPPSFGSC